MEIPYIPGGYCAGCVVSVPVQTNVGTVQHKGILSDCMGPDGYPMVIHNAKLYGEIVESTMTIYVMKALGPVVSEGFPGRLSQSEVVARARNHIGQPWRPFSNCEHFVSWAHGLEAKSPQLRRAGKKAGVMTGLLAVGTLVFLKRPI